jgi:predicted metal-dependent peptidase
MIDGGEAATYTSNDRIVLGSSFEALPLREQIGVLGHHILHIALRHEFQMQLLKTRFGSGFDAWLHNLCSDAIINECLHRGGIALPRPAVLLSELLEQSQMTPIDPARDILAQWEVDRLYRLLLAEKENTQAYAAKMQFREDIRPRHAALKTDRDAGVWRAHLIRAAQSAGSAGRGIGPILRLLADITVSRIPWEQHLRQLLAKALNHHPRRSYRRPRSAWIAAEAQARETRRPHPVFEPAQRRDGVRPRLVIAIDASGSVEGDMLSLFAGEVIGITNRTNAETHLLCFDEDVFAHKRLSALNGRDAFAGLPLRRGGGTSFVDVLHKADALDPSMIVVLTDLMGAFGPKPKAPVLWATPVAAITAPPFGSVLELMR